MVVSRVQVIPPVLSNLKKALRSRAAVLSGMTHLLSAVSLLLIVLGITVSTASANPDSWSALQIEVSDTLLGVDQSEASVLLSIRGRSLAQFSVAANSTTSLFTLVSDSRVELTPGATIIASGKFDRDGRAVVAVRIPSYSSGRAYLQAASSKQGALSFFGDRRIFKDADVSGVVSVSTLAQLVKNLPIQGPKGDRGEVGPTGPQGERGMDGEQGERGPQGFPGEQGVQGIKGDKGETGAAGPQGEQGERGEVGPVGPQGPQGVPGATGPQGPAGVSPTPACPVGWVDLGPTCIEPEQNGASTIEQAIQTCFAKGARICEHQELAFACTNRANLGMDFPDLQWLHTGTIMLRSLSGSSSNNFVGYAVYRRAGVRCFGPSTINPSDAVVSYDLAETARGYYCCAQRS